MSKLKRGDREDVADAKSRKKSKGGAKPSDSTDPPKMTSWKGYDLSELPLEALPIYGMEYKGKHSYTIIICGAVSRSRTFYEISYKTSRVFLSSPWPF